MKKIVAWMLTIIMLVTSVAILIPIYSAYAATDYSIIKVRIANGTPSTQSIKVIGSFVMEEDKSFIIAAGNATIKNSGGKLTITSGGNSKTVGGTITLLNGNPNTKSNLIEMKGYNGTNQYLGDMIFQASGSGILATNRLPIEQYIVGVVAQEMGSSFNLEALKAQAVAARSYAATYIEKRKNGAYHILDGPKEQAYIGYKSNAKLNQAVNETAGQLMLYNGKVIEAYYSASHGGQTAAPSNPWGGGDAKNNQYPYLQIFDDHYDLKRCGTVKGLEEKVFIPTALKGNQGKANATIWGDIMQAFGLSRSVSESSLSSAKINRASYTKQYSNTPESRAYTGVTFNVTVNGSTKDVFIDLTKLNSRGVFTNGNLRMKSCEEGTKDGVAGYYLTNRRFGHGVGLSQYGAQEMSAQGKGYQEILKFYYRGVTLNTSDTGAGWTNEGEGTGVVDDNGNKVYGWYEYEGDTYYMDTNTGAMVKGWKLIDGKWYFFNKSNGQRQYGWLKDGEFWYFLDEKTGVMLANEVREIDGKLYVFNSSGRMQDNRWFSLNGSWYYLNSGGPAAKGWIKLKNIWYYLNPADARMLTGVHEIDGKIYVFDSSGAMQANKWSKQGDTWYYLNSGGAAAKGWLKDKGLWYYLDKQTAKMYVSMHEIEGQIYIFRASGSMVANGWSKQGNTWYYLNGSGAAAKGWKKVSGKWYYLNPTDAKMLTGVIEEGGNIYLLSDSGAMLSNGWKTMGGKWYYLNGSGAAYKGWKTIGGKEYYLDMKTGAMLTGQQEIDGQICIFDKDGRLVEKRAIEQPKSNDTSGVSQAPATMQPEPKASSEPEASEEPKASGEPEVTATQEP